MAKLRGCRVCFVELEQIALADGGAVLYCAACDVMADERHHAGSAPPLAGRDGAKAVETGGRPAQIGRSEKSPTFRKKVLDSVTLPR